MNLRSTLTTLFAFTLLSTITVAQTQTPTQTQTQTQTQTILSYPIQQKLATPGALQNEISLFVKGNPDAVQAYTEQNGGVFKYTAGGISGIRIPMHAVEGLQHLQGVERIEGNDLKLEPMADRMVINNNVILVHIGLSPLPQAYDGTGVVMGIIDTGIDFSHPDFKDNQGKTRVKYIWDHALPGSGNSPLPYGYGREFTKAQIDSGLATLHVDKSNGHGTHVTGIAAGNGRALNNYKGVAPGVDIIAVALDFNKPDNDWLSSIVDASDYIFKKAQAMGKPCVINASVGAYYGSHDGKDLQAQLIDNFITTQNGRSFVCAAGNAGSIPFHVGYTMNSDTSFTWIRNPGGIVFLQMWQDTAQAVGSRFSIGADRTTPNFSYVGNTGFYNPGNALNTLKKDTLFNASGQKVARVERFTELIGDRYSMYYTLIPDSSGYNFRISTTGSGRFDAWSFDLVSSNLPSVITYPDMAKFKAPDLQQTLVSSFTCSPNVITVGEYNNRNSYTDYNGNTETLNITTGDISISSSRGPTRDGRIKPDITSTGNATLAAVVMADIPWFIANQPNKLGAGGFHIRDGGTSSASPVVAGSVALYLQRYPNASNADIRTALLNCPKRDGFTGSALPNNTWGHGKLDAFTTLAGCATGIAHYDDDADGLILYPNPAKNQVKIALPVSGQAGTLSLRDLTGRLLYSAFIDAPADQADLDLQQLSSGTYLVQWNTVKGVSVMKKLIVM